jgi:hypothetical protein
LRLGWSVDDHTDVNAWAGLNLDQVLRDVERRFRQGGAAPD